MIQSQCSGGGGEEIENLDYANLEDDFGVIGPAAERIKNGVVVGDALYNQQQQRLAPIQQLHAMDIN